MYPQCTYSKAREYGTLPPHPLFNNLGTSGKQNFAWYHIIEIMPRSKCTEGGAFPSLCLPRLQTSPLRLHFAFTCHKKAVSVPLKNCVSEKLPGVRVEACTELQFVFAFWYLSLRLYEVRTTLNLKPCLQNATYIWKCCVPSHEIATFDTPSILSNFWPEIAVRTLFLSPVIQAKLRNDIYRSLKQISGYVKHDLTRRPFIPFCLQCHKNNANTVFCVRCQLYA